MSQGQQIDAIIAEEGLTNAPVQPDPEPTPTPDGEIAPVTPTDDKPADTQQPTPLTTIQPEDKPAEDKKDGEVTPVEPEAPKLPEAPAPKVSEQVEQSRSFIDNLNLTEDKIFTAEGTVVPFREVVPPGQFLVAQLEPVRVVDKDGKSHEFLLLSDVEKTFPDGFEAKNNIEDMKFRSGIMDNEAKFKTAVNEYNQAETQYTAETSELVTTRQSNKSTADEYRAMADKGLVPKVDGDINDPKNPAVVELNKLLEYQAAKNAELKAQGYGKISSLFVAKQLMDADDKVAQTDDKKQQIIDERKGVASLSSAPTPSGKDEQPQSRGSVPRHQYIEDIIREEGLV